MNQNDVIILVIAICLFLCIVIFVVSFCINYFSNGKKDPFGKDENKTNKKEKK